MSDDNMLADLFRDAASSADAPPPAFGHLDVLAASHRIGRRRTAMARGALGLLIVAALAAAAILPTQFNRSATIASGPLLPGTNQPEAAAPAVPFNDPGPGLESRRTGPVPPGTSPSPDAGASAVVPPPSGEQPDDPQPGTDPPPGHSHVDPPVEPPVAGSGDPPGSHEPPPVVPGEETVVPPPPPPPPPPAEGGGVDSPPTFSPGGSACGNMQDPELRQFVEEVLPEVIPATEVSVTTQCRDSGDRGISLEVDDNGAKGIFSVIYRPPGASQENVSAGTQSVSGTTKSNGTVTVTSRPSTPEGTTPFATRLSDVLAHLTPRL